MKRMLLAVAAGAMMLTGTMASAQPYNYDRHYDGRRDYQYRNRDHYDRDRAWREDQARRRAYGYPPRYYDVPRYDRRGYWVGQRYPHYNNNRYVIYDYNTYHLPPPRPGYRYYRDDSGAIIMATIAGGVIGWIVYDALTDGR